MMLTVTQLNRRLLTKLLVVAVLMFGFGYAMIPFYKHICAALGIYSIQQADAVPENQQVDASRSIRVEFDSNQRGEGSEDWTFRPLTQHVSLHPGQLQQVLYEVTNRSGRPLTLQAVPRYAPQQAAPYFKKLNCFCFTQQHFAPGETRKMPVVFLLDRQWPKDVGTVTLSYTFFKVEGN